MGSRGNFFAVDRLVWDTLSACGRMNEMVAYLVMARGTGRDQRTTSWSTNAIEKYTRIPRFAARAAIEGLIRSRYIAQTKAGRRPRYVLQPAEEVCFLSAPPRRPLKPQQVQLLEAAKAHPEGIFLPTKDRPDPNWPEGVIWGHAQALIGRGLARRIFPTGIAYAERSREGQTGWIWLPNTIVDGAAGETPPIERIRQSHSASALRLYVDLYQAHALPEAGGVGWRRIRFSYHRHNLGEYGEFSMWAFMPKTIEVFPRNEFFDKYSRRNILVDDDEFDDDEEDPESLVTRREAGRKAFFADLKILTGTGLAGFVPYLVTADIADGSPLHPLAREGEGEAIEQETGAAAQAAALRMLAATGQKGPWDPTARFVAMETHIQHLALVGVLRLRHRPHTAPTAAWIEGVGGSPQWLERYPKLESADAVAG